MAGDLLFGQKILAVIMSSGIVPISVNGVFRIQTERLPYCRFVLFLVLSIQFLSFYLYQPLLIKSTFFYAVAFLNTFGYGLGCFFSILLMQYRFGEICLILNKIRECWHEYQPFPRELYQNTFLTIFIQWNFIVLEVCLLLIAVYWALDIVTNVTYTLAITVSLTTNHFILCCDYFFIILTMNIYYLLKQLNTYFVDKGRGYFRFRLNYFELRQNAVIFRSIYCKYSKIMNIVDDLNECFACINLISFSFSLSAVIFSLFFAVKKSPTHSDLLVTVIDLAYYLFFFINKSVSCLVIVKKTKKEAESTATLIQRLYTEHPNSRSLEEVEMLSLQLLHRKVEFDACGFFKLDFSLLLSMISNVATYILILMQLEHAQVGSQRCLTNLTQLSF